MSVGDWSVCSECSYWGGMHFTHCAYVAAGMQSTTFVPRSVTAYDRAQSELLERIAKLEKEVARLKAWSRPPAEMCLKCGTGFVTPGHATTHSCGPEET